MTRLNLYSFHKMRSFFKCKRVFIMAILVIAVYLLCFWNTNGAVSHEVLKHTRIRNNVKNHICYVNFNDSRPYLSNDPEQNMIYFVTPTYPRPEQIPELTRLAHTLMHVPNIHWIVADDHTVCSFEVSKILKKSGLPFTHISSPKPFKFEKYNFPRGVANRRAALTWLRENVEKGILYFGDDDNTVDLQLFAEIRRTKKVAMLPVGLIGDYGISSPIVKDGKVTGFFDSWPGARTFPVDMAGFAVNIEYLTPEATMPYTAGHEEDKFLLSLRLNVNDIEPLADNCSKILVWHTRTYKRKKPSLKFDLNELSADPGYKHFVNLLREVSNMGMAEIDPIKGVAPFVIQDGRTHTP